MLTWSDLKTNFQDYTKTTDTAALTLGESQMNFIHQKLAKRSGYSSTEYERDLTSVVDQKAYPLPANYGKIKNVVWVDGEQTYRLEEVTNWDEWNHLRSYVSQARPTHYMVVKGATGNAQYELWVNPNPSEADKTLRVVYQRLVPSMSNIDYTDGTIAVTNDSATVTGTGTTFTAAMVGRSIQLPDGLWYDITARTSDTQITVASPYLGSTESGASYIIGEIPIIPEAHQDTIWSYAVAKYWAMERQLEDSAFWMSLYNQGVAELEADVKAKSMRQVFHDDDTYPRTANQYPGPITNA